MTLLISEILNHFYAMPVLKLPFKICAYDSFHFTEKKEMMHFPKVNLPNTILGKQAEFLFECLLKSDVNYKIVSSNIQIQGATKTLGELDYIIQNVKTQDLIHIEFTCKFYLLDTDHSENNEAKWIGPNRKDTLYDKLEKFQNKQFPLLHKQETKKHLQELGVNSENIAQRHCIKASLFIPKNNFEISLSENYKNCVVGYWVRFKKIELHPNKTYAIIEKRSWLLPFSEIKEWSSSTEIVIKISEAIAQKRSPMVYEKYENKILKFFVVWW